MSGRRAGLPPAASLGQARAAASPEPAGTAASLEQVGAAASPGPAGTAAPPVPAPAMTSAERVRAALGGRPTDVTPVWFKRQAGLQIPAYREIVERHAFLTIVRTPELSAQVMEMAMRETGVDAAVLYADVTQPLPDMGVPVTISYAGGPRIDAPLRSRSAIESLHVPSVDEVAPYVAAALTAVRDAVGADHAVIGSLGGPFTVACYAVEGGHDRDFAAVRAMMHGEPILWARLMDRLSATLVNYAVSQVRAGVDALQLFDPWVARLHPADYVRHVASHSRRVLEAVVALSVPTLHSIPDPGLLEPMAAAGGTVIGVDWRVHLDDAWRRTPDRGIMGNLDPALLLAPWTVAEAQIEDILRRAARRPGHVFSLGAPIAAGTDLGAVRRLVDTVRERSAVPA